MARRILTHPTWFVVAGVTLFLLLTGLTPDTLPARPGVDFSDATVSHWPNAHYLRETVREGHFPWWRDTLMAGQPFAANPLNKVWYPPQWLVVILPPALTLNLLTWAALVLGGLGMWTWTRHNRLDTLPALFAALAYALAPRQIGALGAGHLDILYGMGYAPWLLWAIQHWVVNPAARPTLWVVILATMVFLSDVRLALLLYALGAAYGVHVQWTRRSAGEVRPQVWARSRHLRWGLLAAALLLMLTAAQWLTLLDVRTNLTRQNLTLTDAAYDSLQPSDLLSLLIAHPDAGHEQRLYTGILVLSLAIIGLWSRRQVFWAATLVIILWWSFGENSLLWHTAMTTLPPLRWFRVPPRAWLLATLILPYHAAWGLHALTRIPASLRQRKAARLSAAALLTAGTTCWLSSLVMLNSTLPAASLIGLIILPLSIAFVLAAIWRDLPPRLLYGIALLLMLADVTWVDRSLVAWLDRDQWLESYRPVAETLRADGVERIYSPSYSFPQQASAYWHIPQLSGVDPFQLAAVVSAVEPLIGVKATDYSVTLPAFESDDPDATLNTINRDAVLDLQGLATWRVTHIVAAFPIDQSGLELLAQIDEVYIYRNTFVEDGLSLTWDGPNRVTIRSTTPIASVHAVANAIGWSPATEGVALPPSPLESATTYRYTYRPALLGPIISGLGLLGLLLLAIAAIGAKE